MNLLSGLGRVRRNVLSALYCRTVSLGDRGPIVSFTFDDFPRSAALTGASILEQFGGRGTYYLAAELMNTSNELGALFVESDVHSLLEKGHEIGSHTFHHRSCRSLSLPAFQADVEKGMAAVEHLTGRSSGNFAYPFGHFTLGTKKRLAGCLTSARSIMPGINGPDIDLNLLRANRLYGDVDQSRAVKDAIAQNLECKGWLIFCTHDVRPDPSEYGCTPGLLQVAVSEAARRGCRILTVGEVLSQIGTDAGSWRRAVPEPVPPARSYN